jgi:VWFA-related protein
MLDQASFAAKLFAIAVALSLAPLCLGQARAAAGTTASDKPETVILFFTADDGHGTSITNLAKDSLQLREDGRPQTIRQLSPASELPLNIGVMMDSSGAMQGALPAAKAAAEDFLRQVVTQKDLGFAIAFGINVDLLQDLTSDVRLLRSGLETAKTNVGLRSSRSGGLLYDAVYLAADEILAKQVGRKALVIFTAGVDQGSKTKLKDAIQAAQKADAVCYVIQFSRSLFGSSLGDLSDQTGGRTFSVHDGDKLADALRQIAEDLRNQYSLVFTSDNAHHDGSFHSIELTTREGYKIRVRKGYFATGGN